VVHKERDGQFLTSASVGTLLMHPPPPRVGNFSCHRHDNDCSCQAVKVQRVNRIELIRNSSGERERLNVEC
jgi:hypothetical protein